MNATPQSPGEVRSAAEQYVARGWFPVPVPHRRKGPVLDAWQDLRIANVEDVRRYFNGQPQNLGILLGEPSDHLVDVDLDHEDAVALADEYLPPTGSEFGRDGKRRSHRLYVVSEPASTRQWKDDQLGMIVELRSTGVQTVFPPSTHESGEAVRWEIDGEPATVDPDELIAAIDAIANAVRRKHGITTSLEATAPTTTPSVPADVVDRARKYIAKMPPAISGQGGHDAAFSVACKLVVGFGLDRDTALDLMREHNEQCQPPWSENELAHKVDDAMKQPGLRGELLNSASPRSTPRAADKSPRSITVKEKRPKASRVEPFVPFPVGALPEAASKFISSGAKSIGCDPAMIALPLLAGLASAIGSTRQIMLKGNDWCEPPVVWTGVICDSGQQKSPAQGFALGPLRRLQDWKLEEYPDLAKQYEQDSLIFKADLQRWNAKGRANGDPPPEKPVEPAVARYLVKDVTVEALAEQLQMNPRGLLCDVDELSTWLGSFNQYSSKRGGSDASKWLSMHRAESILIDRKTGLNKTIYIKRAAVSVTGGVQPAVLRRALGFEHFENGLAARLLLAAPPKRRKRWNNSSADRSVIEQVERVFARLLALDFGTDKNDSPAPIDVPLMREGHDAFTEFYNELAGDQFEASGHYASALAKIEAAAPRLALIAHLCRWAAEDQIGEDAGPVSLDAMRTGITLANWFATETRRVYDLMAESDVERDQRLLAEWIGGRGGSASVRDVQIGRRRIKSSEEAEAALNDLVKHGHGHWRDIPAGSRGGPPTRRFELHDSVNVYTTPVNPEENVGCVDKGGAGHGPDDDWAEV